MADTYWLRQASEPLFSDLLWSRPENKSSRGKLLIIGGSNHSFAAVSQSYNAAIKAGIGTVRAILPASLEKSLGRVFPEAEFAAANPSGGFARTALERFLDAAAWADGVLLAGDFGGNSETTIVLESFMSKYKGPLTVAGDAQPEEALERDRTAIVSAISQLQKLAADQGIVMKTTDELAQLAKKLADFSKTTKAATITGHQQYVLAAYQGRVSTTGGAAGTELAAYTAVWFTQQPAKVFEAVTTAVFACLNPERI